MTNLERLSREFAGVFENPDSAQNVLAADVFVDLNMPVWRIPASGRRGVRGTAQGHQ